jgi:tripartite-type tricarboxylate transporter receptor subunit TctC
MPIALVGAIRTHPAPPVDSVVRDREGRDEAAHLDGMAPGDGAGDSPAGAIGADLVAKSAPDGYTLLSHTVAVTINPHLVKAPFDVLTDLVPVTQTIVGSYVLVVQPAFPAASLREWIEVVRRNPGRHNYASHGSGTGPHQAMEMLKQQLGLFIVYVPFRGAAPAILELLAGRIEMAFDTSVAGFDSDGWQGLFAPAGTPPDLVARLYAEFVKAARAPEVVRQMAEQGFAAVGSSLAEFKTFVQAEHAKYGRLIRERRIQPD